MIVMVETTKLASFRKMIGETGCRILRERRREGRSLDGTAVLDVEIELPKPPWQGSMSDALYGLPGVRLLRAEVGHRWPVRLINWCRWQIGRSGT